MMKKIRRLINLIKPSYLNKCKYNYYYDKLSIDENIILLDSQHGENINGNIFYLLKDLKSKKKYSGYKIYLIVNKEKLNDMIQLLEKNNINDIQFVKVGSKKYYKIYTIAKYLITDTSLPVFFIKKDTQIILNTWHGTPLKTLGRSDNNEFHRIGNIQKNFFISDYLLYPNKFTMEHITQDYMLKNITNAKILLAGYPRNEAFFDNKLEKKIRKEQNLENKEVLIYMPTWRGTIDKQDYGIERMINYLDEIEKQLSEQQILYVNLHPFLVDIIDYSKYKRIKPFPKEYETYQFLNIADCLITDYSSVFFDFAIKQRKIILFTYDEEEYLKERGLYLNLEALPFAKVKSVSQLMEEINAKKEINYNNFINKFCKYENKKAAENLLDVILFNKQRNIKTISFKNNKKENILIYAGNLAMNGITTSILNLLNSVDLKKYNYYLTFTTSKVNSNKYVLKKLPQDANYIGTIGKINLSLFKKSIQLLYSAKLLPFSVFHKFLKKDYEKEIKRLYGNIEFNHVIQFSGYEYRKMYLLSLFKGNKIIYAHNDMYKEIYKKRNQRIGVCKYSYKTYDKIALVTDDLIEPTSKILDVKDKFKICNNIFNYRRILNLSKENIKFDDQTESNIPIEKFRKILNNEKLKKIIAIGRFSKEKGNDRLLIAFNDFWKTHKDAYLVIIGGYGPDYDNLKKMLSNLECKNSIAMIKFMSNPYAVLNKCDGLILPSRYEGFGLVIIEADVLNKPVVSTRITGPTNFMLKHGGTLVDNSIEGIKEGLELLYNSKIKPMNVDYDQYNENAIQQFYNLLK